jgi:hypothetical protein
LEIIMARFGIMVLVVSTLVVATPVLALAAGPYVPGCIGSDLSGLATSEAAPGPPSFGLDAAGFAQAGEIQSLFEAFCGS